MNLNQATATRPLFTVLYQYKNGSTFYSFIEYFAVTGDKKKTTMTATDDEALAKRCADFMLTQPMVVLASVNKHKGGLGHETIYSVEKQLTKA